MSLTHRPAAPLLSTQLPPTQLALHRGFFRSLLFGLAAGAAVMGLGWGLSQVPQPEIAAFQTRNAALRACQDALSGQQLAGHVLDGFRLIPSSVTQRGEKVSAQYRAREHGTRGWNSGPILTLNCEVERGAAHLNTVSGPEAHE